MFWLVHSAFNLLDTTNSLLGCAGNVSRSLKSMASCAILDECIALDEATDGPVWSPATTDAYVTGIELNFGNIGGSKSKSSVSKGVLYRPNLEKKNKKKSNILMKTCNNVKCRNYKKKHMYAIKNAYFTLSRAANGKDLLCLIFQWLFVALEKYISERCCDFYLMAEILW